MESLGLRPATSDDSDFVFAVQCAAMRPWVEPIYGWDEDWQSRHFREHFDPDERHIIRYAGIDVGSISTEVQRAAFSLKTIGILPAYQGRGIGIALIRRLQQNARQEGLPVTLQVLRGNPARSLYERLGETDTHYQMR